MLFRCGFCIRLRAKAFVNDPFSEASVSASINKKENKKHKILDGPMEPIQRRHRWIPADAAAIATPAPTPRRRAARF